MIKFLKKIIPEPIMPYLRRLKEFYRYNLCSRSKLEAIHWKKKKKRVGDLYTHQIQRYGKCFEVFDSLYKISRYEKAIDIGSGPCGGILDLIDANEKWVAEPIYSKYKRDKVWCPKSDVIVRETRAEDMLDVPTDFFDVVFTANAIDHGDDIGKCIANISNILKIGGRLYLHVHCRKPHELNSLHRQAFSPSDLERMFDRHNLFIVNKSIYEKDPLSGKYETFVGVLEKVAN